MVGIVRHCISRIIVAFMVACPTWVMAGERAIVFSSTPPEKVQLVESLLSLNPTEKDDLRAGIIDVRKNVRIADVVLNAGKPPSLFILNEAEGWCGTDGCGVTLWEHRRGGWVKLREFSTQGDGALYIQDICDQHYHRLVERRSMLVGDENGLHKMVNRKPIVYRWTGTAYQRDGHGEP